jgi:hypothetical protein
MDAAKSSKIGSAVPRTKAESRPGLESGELRVLTQPDINRGVYSNLAVLHHTEHEFILDFLLQLGSDAQLVSRVVLSPDHMRRLSKAIAENLSKYDESFSTPPDDVDA